MANFKLRVDTNSLNGLKTVIRERIVLPRLQKMRLFVRASIADKAFPFKAVGTPFSLADVAATKATINAQRMSLKVRPVLGTEEKFLKNLEGFSQGFDIRYNEMSSDLQAWVHLKYNGLDKPSILASRTPLHIRGFADPDIQGVRPLGHPLRDFFGRGFVDLLKNVRQLGITR